MNDQLMRGSPSGSIGMCTSSEILSSGCSISYQSLIVLHHGDIDDTVNHVCMISVDVYHDDK